MLKRITLQKWRQFEAVDINFHDRLTVLTGANGAGKTTILHLLNRHWGWNLQFVSAPRFTDEGERKLWAGFWGGEPYDREAPPIGNETSTGRIEYSDDSFANLYVPDSVSDVFSVRVQPMKSLAGVYVSSHRPLYIHQKVDTIPTELDARQQMFQTYVGELQSRHNINQTVRSPSHRIKQTLISLAALGFGNEAVATNQEAVETFRGFEQVLKVVLPSSIGFNKIKIRVPDVLLETDSGEFAFDAVSSGISALIDVAWQVYLCSLIHDSFVVVIDEPEAHLHPELQRLILPSLLESFPTAQFIVATHSPLVISSVRDSNVVVFRYDENRRVFSQPLDMINKAGSSNEILREVLGIEASIPVWVEIALSDIVEQFSSNSDFSNEAFEVFRHRLSEVGLEKYIPKAISDALGQGEGG